MLIRYNIHIFVVPVPEKQNGLKPRKAGYVRCVLCWQETVPFIFKGKAGYVRQDGIQTKRNSYRSGKS